MNKRNHIIAIMLIISACSPEMNVTTIVTTASSESSATAGATDAATSTTGHDCEPTTADVTTSTTTDTTEVSTTASSTSLSTTDGTTSSTSSTTTGTSTTTDTTTGEVSVCGDLGMLFGPCVDGNACVPPFACNNSTKGHMCIPPFWYVDIHFSEISNCLSEVGGALDCDTLQKSWCQIGCGFGCDGKTICDANASICVYPYDDDVFDPGETLGPCMNPDLLCLVQEDECMVPLNVSGSICVPPGGEGLVACASDVECTTPGMICAQDLGFCVWSI